MRFVSGKHLRRPLVQELVPEAADETLHEGLLGGLAGRDVVRSYFLRLAR